MRDIRTLLINNERASILSNAKQSDVHGEVQGIFHTNALGLVAEWSKVLTAVPWPLIV